MTKNIALPISGPSANEITRLKSFQFKHIIEINKNKKIESSKRVNRARIWNFCMHLNAFLLIFITLLLFTVFTIQEKMNLDADGSDDNMVLLGATPICQFEKATVDSADVKFSLTYTMNRILRPTCLFENSTDFSTKKLDKNRPVAQQTPGSDPSQRPFFATNDNIAGKRHRRSFNYSV